MEGLMTKLLIRRAFLWLSVSALTIVLLSLIVSSVWHWKAALPLIFLAGTEVLHFCQNFSGSDSGMNTFTISLNSAVYVVFGICVSILVYTFGLAKFDDMHDLMMPVLQFGCGLLAQFVMFREVSACQRLTAGIVRLGLVPTAFSASSKGEGRAALRDGDREEEDRGDSVLIWRDMCVLLKKRSAEALQRSVWVALRLGFALSLLWMMSETTILCADTLSRSEAASDPYPGRILLELLTSVSLLEIWYNIAGLCLLCLICYNTIADSFNILMSYPMNMHKACQQLLDSTSTSLSSPSSITSVNTSVEGATNDTRVEENYRPSVQVVMSILASHMPLDADDVLTLWSELQRTRSDGVNRFATHHKYSCHTVHSGHMLAKQIVAFSDKIMMKCLQGSISMYRSSSVNAGAAGALSLFSWLDPFAGLHMGATSSASTAYLLQLLSHDQQGMFSLLQFASLEDCVRVFSADTRVARLKRKAFFADPLLLLHFLMNMVTRINMFTLHMDVLMKYCDASNYASYCRCLATSHRNDSDSTSSPTDAKCARDVDDILLKKSTQRIRPGIAGVSVPEKDNKEICSSDTADAAKEGEKQTPISGEMLRTPTVKDLSWAMYAQNAPQYPAEFEGGLGAINPAVYVGRRFLSSVACSFENTILRTLLNNKLSKAIPAVGAFDFSSTLVVNSSSDNESVVRDNQDQGDVSRAHLKSSRTKSGTASGIGNGFNGNERSTKQVLFNRPPSVPVTALHQSKNMMFSHVSSAFATSPRYLQMVSDSLTIITQVFAHSNDDESSAGLVEGFLPLVLKSLIELNLSCNRYVAIYCDNYHQTSSNQMKIKLLRSVALQYLPELHGLLQALECSMRAILLQYQDVLFKGMSLGTRNKSPVTEAIKTCATGITNSKVFHKITHCTSAYRDNFSLAEWRFLCEAMAKAYC